MTTLSAVDDAFTVVASGATVVDVLDNDEGEGLQVVSVTQPIVGSVAISADGLVEVSLPDSFAGSIEFEYDVQDELGRIAGASVVVESVNVLAAAGGLLAVDDSEPVASLGELRSRVESIYLDLISVRLSTFQFTVLSFAPLLLGLLFWMLRQRDRLVAVTDVSRKDVIHGSLRGDDSVVALRHDSLLWTRNRTRQRNGTSQTLVQLADGQQAWVNSANIADTGY